MTFADFRDAANQLRFVDRHQVPFLSEDDWPRFRDDPVRFTLSPKNRSVAERIWDAAQPDTFQSIRPVVESLVARLPEPEGDG